MTQKELLAIVKAMNHDRTESYHEELDKGNKEEANILLHESMILDCVEWLIEDRDYAEKVVEIYRDVINREEVTQ